MDIIITILALLALSHILSLAFKRLNISHVVPLILTGVLAGLPLLREIIIEPNTEFIIGLGEVALIFMMALAGFESSWETVYKEKKDAVIIAFFAAIIPLLLGFFVSLFLGFSVLVAAMIGIFISITAEGTTAEILMEIKKIKTRVGSAMMGAGIVDDIMGLILFIFVSFFLGNHSLKKDILVAGAILAYFVGVIIKKELGKNLLLIRKIKKAIRWSIIPFFFIMIGMYFSLESLIINPLLLLTITTIAIIGKLAGTLLSGLFLNLRLKQLYLVGWAMNSRGALEMALLFIAFTEGFIPLDVYSALIVMALITTLMFPFIMKYMIRKEPKIMD